MDPINRRALLWASLFVFTAPEYFANAEDNWPQFRGIHASGYADSHPTPVKWNGPRGENIRWKTPIPGLAHSSPIIWEDRLFVTTAVCLSEETSFKAGLYGSGDSAKDIKEHSWRIYCLDRHTGKILWEKESCRGVPKVKRHIKATHANATPTTDGKRVVAFFGSEGIYCYDFKGNLVWQKDLGILDVGPFDDLGLEWGFSSSPIIHKGKVILQCDVKRNPFIAALDVQTGDELWLTPRQENPTWCTPTVHLSKKREQVVLNGYKQIAGYDLSSGKRIWKLRGGGDIPVPAPVISGDLIFITNAHGPMAPVYAIRADAEGDIKLNKKNPKDPRVAWWNSRGGNYMQTPLVYRDYLYSCRDNGVVTCYEAATGKEIYKQRLGAGQTGFTASAVAADGRLYYTNEDGEVYVVRAGPVFEILSKNPLGDLCMASPAISQGMLYFRTQHQVFSVGQD